MIWATVRSWSCFADCVELLHLLFKEYNQSDFHIDHLVMSMCSVVSCVVGKRFAVTSIFSWQISVGLFPASFCTPRPDFLVIPGISWLPTFALQSPMMKRYLLESLVGLHRTVQLQLFKYLWLRHRLGLPWYWMVCLGNEQRSFCRFWDCIQVLHFGLFYWLWWLLHFF